jgi:predicted alpha/beta superfamily hydrolase
MVGAAYFGHSYGGLFGAWVLLEAPATFARYGLSSPSLWWDSGLMFRREAEYAAEHEDLAARVLVSVGGLENAAAEAERVARMPEPDRAAVRAEAATDRTDMVAGAALFADALKGRNYPNLELEYQVQSGETHASSCAVSLSRSLRFLFDVWG